MITDEIEYQRVTNDITAYAKGIISEKELKKFQAYIQHKLENFAPTLMVYGTYNSGKSTLINAIFGVEEMAKTGDAPETSQVHAYEYDGYTIYDTPGINAPIEHENVTQEHLKKCEMILFVLSNAGSFEEEYIYQKIIDIVKTGKPLLIVLNNKKNSDPNSKEAIAEFNKVNINLSKIGDREGIHRIEEKVSLLMVDARTGLEGKIEHEQELIDESNILSLEKKVKQLLIDSGSTEVIHALNKYIVGFIDQVINRIDLQIDNPELRKTEELLTSLEKIKSRNEIELTNFIDRKSSLLACGLRERLLNNSSEKEVLQYLEEETGEIASNIESSFEKVSNEVNQRVKGFSKEIDAVNISYGEIDLDHCQDSNQKTSTMLQDTIKKTLQNKELVSDVTKKALLQLRGSKLLFKGRWEKTLGSYASKFALVLNLLVGVYEIHQAIKSHNEQVEAQRQHVLSAKNKSEEITNQVRDGLLSSVDEVSNSLFGGLLDSFKQASHALDTNHQHLLVSKNHLQRISAQLHS